MFSKVINFFDHSYSRNVAFTFLMGTFCIILGSTSTALLLVACAALIFLNVKITISEVWFQSVLLLKQMPMIAVFPAFYIFVVLTSMRGDSWLSDSIFVAGSYWQFFAMVPASVGLYHLSKDVNFAGLFSLGCRFGLFFVVPLSLIQIYFLNLRPEGMLSNSLVFASLSIVGAGLAVIEWPEDNQKSRTLSWVLFASGLVAALLTFSRGMLLPIIVVVLIAAFYRFKVKSSYKVGMKTIAITTVIIIATFVGSLQTDNGWRILNKRVLVPIEMFSKGEDFDRSISQRLDMQITGFYAFLEKPIKGHGIQNAVSQANAVSQDILGRETKYTYTHLHNDYLTHAVGGGFILLFLFAAVIFSPVFLSWQLRKAEGGTGLFYFSLMLSGAYSTIALTNIVFHNDQLTTMFCTATMFIIVRFIQIKNGTNHVRIPNLPTIANGINPIGLNVEPHR